MDAPDPISVNTLQVYCAIRVISGVAKLKVVTQKCVVQNRGYFMSELYGLGDMSKEEGEGRECVICMTNDRDTCVMPCRHVCCCAECANTLRLQSDRCPVCREAITELVYLTVNPDYLNAQRDQSGTLNVEMNNMGSWELLLLLVCFVFWDWSVCLHNGMGCFIRRWWCVGCEIFRGRCNRKALLFYLSWGETVLN